MDRATEIKLQQEFIASGRMQRLPYSPRNLREDEEGTSGWDHGLKIVLVDNATLDYFSQQALMQLSEMECWDGTLGDAEWAIVEVCGLTDRQSECFRMYHWQKIPQEEIARILDIGQPRVVAHLIRAAKKIAKYLKKSIKIGKNRG